MVLCCFGGNFEKDSQTPSFEYAMSNVEEQRVQRGNNNSIKKLYPSLSEMSDIEGNEITPSYIFKKSNIGKCTQCSKIHPKSEILERLLYSYTFN